MSLMLRVVLCALLMVGVSGCEEKPSKPDAQVLSDSSEALSNADAKASDKASAEWRHWHGPTGTGAVAGDRDTPHSFDPDTGENIKWATEMPGPSAATPIVVGDWVFSPAGDEENFRLLACGLDRKTGEIKWTDDVGEARKSRSRSRENNHAVCSPVADDRYVYFLFGSGDLAAYTHAGEKQWQVNLSQRHGKIEILWGYASSPILLDGKLYVQVLRRTPNSLLICIDPATGETLYAHERPTTARVESLESYASPIVATVDGKPQIVVYGGDALTGHDPDTGKELWRYDQDLNPQDNPMFRVISGPTQGDNGLIYVTSPRGEDLLAIEVKDNTPTLKWYKQDVDADVPCPVYRDGELFVLSGGKRILYKFDAETGDEKWSGRIDSSVYFRGTPTVAGDSVYIVNGEGQAYVFSAGDRFEQRHQVALGGYPSRAAVAVADDDLYIRTGKQLLRIGK